MGILFGIAVGMMHSVHHRIRSRNKIGRTLGEPGHKINGFFPSLTRCIQLMGCITVKEEGMKKQGRKPMKCEKR